MVAVGSDLGANILTTFMLAEVQVCNVWAKAVGPTHERTLRRVGAHQVLTLARGRRARRPPDRRARPDRMQADEPFTVIKARPPRDCLGRPPATCHLLDRDGVALAAVNAVKQKDGPFSPAGPATELSADIILICGRPRQIDALRAARSLGAEISGSNDHGQLPQIVNDYLR
ncbi:hypothetical protein [Streptosporangium roseum]|uniref:hypothetical protein n=1 Tax=Streptosporangium roseum TaxID=2001 RepID=UPI003326854E